MPPVTVDSGAISGAGSGNTGWSARDLFLVNDPADYFFGGAGGGIDWGSTSRPKVAQVFTASSNFDCAGVVVSLAKSGSPTDNLTVTLETTSGGAPSGSVLATSNVVSASTGVAVAYHSVLFTFASPPSLTSGTAYAIVLNRSSGTTTDFFSGASGATAYANGQAWLHNGSVWTNPGTQYDFNFVALKTTQSLYRVTQDANLHVWKSTDNGASWSEINNAGAPAVNSSTKPFSAYHRWDARGVNQTDNCRAHGLYVGYFSGTNSARVRRFSIVDQTWDSTDVGGADFSTDVDFNRNVRVVPTILEVDFYYTSLADDADLEYVRYDGTMSGQNTVLAATSTEASCFTDVLTDRSSSVITDANRFRTNFHYDVAADHFTVRTVAAGTTQGTATDLDATAADVETEHASAVYQTYAGAGGVDTVVAAFIDADGTLEERTAQLEVTSASIAIGTQHEVSASTNYAGRSLATCKFGSDLFIFACTGSAIDVHRDVGAAGSWTAQTGWLSGLTNAVVSSAVPITDVGILVSYTDNGDAKVNLYTVSIPASLTAGTATANAAGEAVTLDAAAKLTVTEATAPAAGQAVGLTGKGTLGVTEATAPAQGEAVTLDAAALFTVDAAAAPASGETVSLTGQGRLAVDDAEAPAASDSNLTAASLFTVDDAEAPAAADANLTAASLFVVDDAEAPAAAENVSLTGAAVLTVDAAEAPAAGEAVDLVADVAAILAVSPATADAAADVTLDAASLFTVDAATAPADGGNVNLAAASLFTVDAASADADGAAVTLHGQGVLGVTEAQAPAAAEAVDLIGVATIAGTMSVDPATATADGATVNLTGAALFTVDAAAAPAQGEGVTFDAAALFTVTPASASAAAQTIGLTGQAVLTVTPSDADAAADSGLTAAAILTLGTATADAAAAGDFLTTLGDLYFTLTASQVVAFTIGGERVMTFDERTEPVLAFATTGDFNGD